MAKLWKLFGYTASLKWSESTNIFQIFRIALFDAASSEEVLKNTSDLSAI